MTNFQADAPTQRRWLTPERAVLVLPVLAGVVITGLLLAFGFTPLLYQVQQRHALVRELERKQAELPLRRRQLVSLLQRQDQSRAQQERLLQLVAGTGQLRTWLAQLNRIAAQQGVAVLAVEPQAIERGVAKPLAGTPPPPADPNKPPPPPADPLLAPNLEKRSVLLTVQGPFPSLRAFLQQLELLQVIVIASDLELELVPATTTGAKAAQPRQALTKLKLRLSAYGRSAKAAS
jgi:type IV pilus assembly protein PilO